MDGKNHNNFDSNEIQSTLATYELHKRTFAVGKSSKDITKITRSAEARIDETYFVKPLVQQQQIQSIVSDYDVLKCCYIIMANFLILSNIQHLELHII